MVYDTSARSSASARSTTTTTPSVAGTTTSAAQARPGGQYDSQDQARASHPRVDQRVSESSLASTENTRSESCCEFWQGTRFATIGPQPRQIRLYQHDDALVLDLPTASEAVVPQPSPAPARNAP